MNKSLILIASVCALFVSGLRRQFCTANGETTVGRHAHATTKLADGAHASRHLIVKIGSDDDHVTPAGASDLAFGVTDDQPSLAEQPINVQFLGVGVGTKRFIAVGALNDNVAIYQAANGQVQGEPTVAGTYYRIGRTKGAAVQGDDTLYYVEAVTQEPQKVIVLAAFTAPGTAAAADLGTAEALANACKADLAALAGALLTPAQVKILAA